MAEFRSYMICTSPRSGSTLLCGLLKATGRAGLPDSHFHRPALAAWLKSYGLAGKPFADDRAAMTAVLEAARARGTGDTGIFGLRMQRHSFDYFMARLDEALPGHDTDMGRIEAAFGPTRLIHLTRADKLDQAISLVKARQTGLWHRAPDGTEIERLSEPREPVYDREEIARQVAELTAMDVAWRDWFVRESVEPIRIAYDALAADPIGTLAVLLRRLGLDPALAEGLPVPVARLSDATNRDWAARFRAECSGSADLR